MKFISKLFKNEEGATAIEYGLIAALVAVAAIVGMNSLGSSLGNQFNAVGGKISNSTNAGLGA